MHVFDYIVDTKTIVMKEMLILILETKNSR